MVDALIRGGTMRVVVLVFLAAALGCELEPTGVPASPDAYAFGATDASEYQVPTGPGERVRIGFVYSNRTHATVWIIRCGGPRPDLQKLVDGEWERATGGLQLDCLTAVPVEPGAQLRDEMALSRHELEARPIEGTYRLIWREVVWGFEKRTETSLFGDLLPLEARVSNTFRLHD